MLQISDLPEQVIRYIKEFIPEQKLVFVNSMYYKLYHHTLKKRIRMYDNYVRDMIRRDNEYVFENIIRENLDLWLKNKQYIYKNMIFNNYIYFVMNYCIENNSDRCRELINCYFPKGHLCRNLHKKNVVKYIKWKN